MKGLKLRITTCFMGIAALFLVSAIPANCQNSELENLFEIIPQTGKYDSLRLKSIDSLKTQLNQVAEEKLQLRHQLSYRLFREYESFRYDSAYRYIEKTQRLASQLQDPEKVHIAQIGFGQICVSAGMYKEALDTLLTIQPNTLMRENRSLYYGLLGRCYGEMEKISNIPEFSEKYKGLAAAFRDSALVNTEEGTFFNSFLKGFIKFQSGEEEYAYQELNKLLEEQELGQRDYAVVNYVLGNIARDLNMPDSAISYWARAALADIKSATKETLAIIKLAKMLFDRGETGKAAILIRKANEDALYFGAQQRKIEIVEILPYIEQQVIQRIEKQKQRLIVLGIVVSALLVFVILLAVIIYRQMLKIKKAKAAVSKANKNLEEANQKKEEQNQQLQQINQLLLEANKIKEEYIGNFFIRDSAIFEKLENYLKKIDEKLRQGKIKEINHLVKTFDPEKEKSELLANFDKIFIQLFPDFISQFNSLFREEDRMKIKSGEVLNIELRIFALIRLGIKHNEKIAQILGYSVNTIYTYKTKVRNKSIVDNDDFDKKLIEVTEMKL